MSGCVQYSGFITDLLLKHHYLGYGVWIIQALKQNRLVVDVPDLKTSNKKITKSKRTQDKLTEEIYEVTKILDDIGDLLFVMDENRIISRVNKSTCVALKKKPEDLIGKHCYEVMHGTDEPWHDCPAGKTLETKHKVTLEVNDPNIGMPLLVTTSPIFDEKGKLIRCVHIAIDITERKKMEVSLKESRDKLERMNEKLSVVGSLTRHDVRNKLSAVTGYAYLLKKKHSDLPDVVDGLRKMEQAVAESGRIFDFAKMYEQLGAEELTYVRVDEKLNEALALFSGSIPTLFNECHGLTLLADSFLRQLFFNFVDNTRRYGKKTTTIRVHFEKADQNRLNLIYEDDGVGIPLENKPHLFKEAFSTGGSTGFGLFLTKKMIDVYGWTITEEGEPGKGAKFTIAIPKLNRNGKENYQIALWANSRISWSKPKLANQLSLF